MCAGAMLHARLARVVFGAADPRTGAAGSVLDLFAETRLNHHTRVEGGVLDAECGELLRAFFRERRDAARQAAEPLRDDALRTPAERFDALADFAFTPHYVCDLPSLQGWRLAYLDEGPRAAPWAFVCLHGFGEWSYLFRHLAAVPGIRVLAPDLIGMGRSDKPKRETVHTLAWHQGVLLEWLDRLQPGPCVLLHSAAATELASLLAAAAPGRFVRVLAAPEGGEEVGGAWRTPFPDRGYEAALRALGPARARASGPSATQAEGLARDAMGYSTP